MGFGEFVEEYTSFKTKSDKILLFLSHHFTSIAQTVSCY